MAADGTVKFQQRVSRSTNAELYKAYYEDKSDGRVKTWDGFLAQCLKDRASERGRFTMRALQS